MNRHLNSLESRRQFFGRSGHLLGSAALATLMGQPLAAAASGEQLPGPHFAPTAKRVIYLHMVGGPAQMDLFDYKPVMQQWYDKDLPDSVRMGQRLTTMTSGQKRFPIAPSKFKFSRAGECGMWMNTQLLPNLAKKADEICWMRSLHTEAINHEPAITALQTGNQVTGRPCLGSWASYGLGTMNENLPAFVVLVAIPSNREQEQAISARLWSAGYLSGEHAGVSFRSKGDPILYINNPPGVPDFIRKRSIQGINAANELAYDVHMDPETKTRMQQYEMAFRMQASVPELTDLSQEPEHIFQLYGEQAKKPGSFRQYGAHDATPRGTRRAVHSGVPQQLGPSRQRGRQDAESMQGYRSALLRTFRRPQTTRHAGRHVGDLGWRVWTHDLLARWSLKAELRSRPSPALLHDVDGGRRCKGRGYSW